MPNTLLPTNLTTSPPSGGVAPALTLYPPEASFLPVDAIGLPQASTSVTRIKPAAFPVQLHAATKGRTYADDVYHRIRYLPAYIDLGALVSGQVEELLVWNQYSGTQVLTALGLINGDGITITGPTANAALAENGFQKYLITVDEDGPAAVNASLVFNWATVPDNSIGVVGLRVVPFPFLYGKGTKETLSWSTRVITANDGSEQRIKVRRSPRQSFSVTSFVPFHLHNMAETLLYGWRDNHWGVPDFPACVTLDVATVIGETTVFADTVNAQYVIGGTGIIYNSPTDYEIVQIASVSSTEITTTSPITKVFDTNAVVVPMLSARMVNSPSRQTTGFGSYITAEFEGVQNSTLPSAASPIQYLGEDVFLDEQLSIEGGVKDVYSSRVDTLDFGSGNVGTFAPWTSPKKSRTFGLQLNDQKQLFDFKTWLHRRAGKLRPFWCPTHEVNFKVVSVGPVNTSLQVRDDGQSVYGANRKHIMIVSGDDKILTEITSMVTDGSVITMTILTDIDRDASAISHIEYLALNRLASDRIEIAHGSNFDSFVSVPIIELST